MLINENLIIKKISISFIKNKIYFETFSIPFTIFCIIILINALNFFDGVNGQSCIFFIIIFTFLTLKSNFNLFYIINIFIILFVLILNLKKEDKIIGETLSKASIIFVFDKSYFFDNK